MAVKISPIYRLNEILKGANVYSKYIEEGVEEALAFREGSELPTL